MMNEDKIEKPLMKNRLEDLTSKFVNFMIIYYY